MHERSHGTDLERVETPEEVTRDLLRRTYEITPRFWTAILVLGLLFAGGVAGFVMRYQGGFEDRVQWGYYAATFVYLLTIFQGGPIVSMMVRAVKGHWGRPLSRASEIFAVVGILSVFMYLPLLALLPPLEGRRSVWMSPVVPGGPTWPGAPQLWDALAVIFLAVCGLGFLYASSLPDLAAARDHGTGARLGLWRFLARGWRGTTRQWQGHYWLLLILGAFYLIFYVLTHFLIAADFAMSLVPGWIDPIFPAHHALGGLQSAVAITIVALVIMRWVGGYEEYVGLVQVWGLARIMLALALLWFYFWFAAFIIFWYGRQPPEQGVLQLIMFGPYSYAFYIAFASHFVLPLVLLMWNRIRVSILGPFVVAIIILTGNIFNQIRLYVAIFSVEKVTGHELEAIPPTHYPDLADILIIVGAVAGAILLYLLATKIVPLVSISSRKEGLTLTVVRTYLKTRVLVIAKPR